MKISRKQLRDMILETAIDEQSRTGSAGARKTRDEDGDTDLTRRDIEGFVKRVVDAVVGEKSFNALITVGRSMTRVARVAGDAADMKGDIKQAIKDDADIQTARADLKRFRAVKVTYEKAADAAAETSSEMEKTEERPPETRAPGGSDCTDGEEYDYGEKYLYRVNKCTGCWEGKKKAGGSWFSMKKYKKNMGNLDAKYGDARGGELREKCPAETSERPGEPRDDTAPGKAPPAKTKAPGASALNLGEQAIIYLMAAGTNRTLGTLGPALVTLYQKGDEASYKEVISQVRRANPNFKSVNTPALAFAKPKGAKGSGQRGLLDLSNVTNKNINTPEKFNAYAKNVGMGTALKLALNSGGAFDLSGFDESSDNKALMPVLKDALGKFFGARGGTLNEALESLGKSRGTLLRERYWGRY